MSCSLSPSAVAVTGSLHPAASGVVARHNSWRRRMSPMAGRHASRFIALAVCPAVRTDCPSATDSICTDEAGAHRENYLRGRQRESCRNFRPLLWLFTILAHAGACVRVSATRTGKPLHQRLVICIHIDPQTGLNWTGSAQPVQSVLCEGGSCEMQRSTAQLRDIHISFFRCQ